MNAPSHIALSETQQIERALDALLTAATNAPSWLPSVGGLRPLDIAAIITTLRTSTTAQRAAADLVVNPVGEALRIAVRTLGERLYEIGGLSLMRETCDRVADQDPANWSQRVNIMDKRWDGIGGWCC